MNNKIALIISGAILFGFFIGGLLDILDNFMIQLILFLAFFGFIGYLIKVNTKKHKKNLPK